MSEIEFKERHWSVTSKTKRSMNTLQCAELISKDTA